VTRPTFHYPFAGGWPVSSGYGPRGDSFHTGTDFAVPPDVEILASNDGQVIYAAYEAGGAGNTVTIAGADGWQSRYHHQSRSVVAVGQSIRAGQLVGYCDSTGASSGPHLHFEIRSNAGATTHDPIPILETDAGQLPGPGSPTEPSDDLVALWEEHVLLIINEDRGAAILLPPLLPRKIESVNSYKGPFAFVTAEAFDAFFEQAIDVYNATTR
jgi:hypothetical protein